MELADDPGAGARGLVRVQEVVGRALEARGRVQRGVERLDDPLRVAPAALDDRRDTAPLVGQVAAVG